MKGSKLLGVAMQLWVARLMEATEERTKQWESGPALAALLVLPARGQLLQAMEEPSL